MQKFTKEQAIVITGLTGVTACDFSSFHEDVEKRLGYPIWTHQFADEAFVEKVKQAYKDDFIAMCYSEKENENV